VCPWAWGGGREGGREAWLPADGRLIEGGIVRDRGKHLKQDSYETMRKPGDKSAGLQTQRWGRRKQRTAAGAGHMDGGRMTDGQNSRANK
jgi:hypothetical protein